MHLLGHPFECITSDVPEDRVEGESPADHVKRLSVLKAKSVGDKAGTGIIIGSDTIVLIDGVILEKPMDRFDAIEMVMKLQGRTHTVYTGFALYSPEDGRLFSGYETTEVTMMPFSVELAEKYIDTGEPFDKAGAYGIQGYGAALITEIKGCYFNVMGLPLARLMEALYNFSNGRCGYFGLTTEKRDESCT